MQLGKNHSSKRIQAFASQPQRPFDLVGKGTIRSVQGTISGRISASELRIYSFQIEAEAGLIIVESDVVVKKNTLQALFNGAAERADCGIAAAVTVDEKGEINYPYLFAKGKENQVFPEKKHCSFCCSLLTLNFLKAFDFHQLNPEKNWHDVTVSHQSLKEGFKNYLFTTLPVLHQPHGSRPWKQLKYKNPLKYYWLKYTKGLDKI